MLEKQICKSEPFVSRIIDSIKSVLSDIEFDPFGSWKTKKNKPQILEKQIALAKQC